MCHLQNKHINFFTLSDVRQPQWDVQDAFSNDSWVLKVTETNAIQISDINALYSCEECSYYIIIYIFAPTIRAFATHDNNCIGNDNKTLVGATTITIISGFLCCFNAYDNGYNIETTDADEVFSATNSNDMEYGLTLDPTRIGIEFLRVFETTNTVFDQDEIIFKIHLN